MKYEYNGNLKEEERIDLVSNEIINKYPQISIDKAKDAAMLEGKISSDKDFEMEFNRLYNIMLVESDNKDLLEPVYNDLINLLKENSNNEKIEYYCNIAIEITNFLNDKRDFPYMIEFV
ncbi:MAG TPA: hypothetical protein IAB68_00945 [Candidatus Aphodocola excrementigallinarum]|uniref:Uncharacterized protein n=1 Tax=Candidatus Aphodocola excrementigallinarum TaxID=2840670 RepID=A0A9D1LGJ5_9FIRM|nr:hypothetical protein [Candidatus Aphodocola excrementigallinarum]